MTRQGHIDGSFSENRIHDIFIGDAKAGAFDNCKARKLIVSPETLVDIENNTMRLADGRYYMASGYCYDIQMLSTLNEGDWATEPTS